MPAYPKSQSLHDTNRAERTKGGGLRRVKGLETSSELRPISKRREAKLKAQGVTLTGSTFAPASPLKRIRKVGTYVRNGKTFRKPRPPGKPRFGEKVRKVLRKVGERGRRLYAGDAKWRNQVWAVWGACPFTGKTRDTKECECHHCYDKSAHPEWRHAVWVGIPIYKGIHDLVDPTIPLKQAFEQVADEQRAASEGRRPDVTPEEVRSIVLSAVPDLMERIGWGRPTKPKRKEAS